MVHTYESITMYHDVHCSYVYVHVYTSKHVHTILKPVQTNKQTFLFIENDKKAGNLRQGMAGIEPMPSKS